MYAKKKHFHTYILTFVRKEIQLMKTKFQIWRPFVKHLYETHTHISDKKNINTILVYLKMNRFHWCVISQTVSVQKAIQTLSKSHYTVDWQQTYCVENDPQNGQELTQNTQKEQTKFEPVIELVSVKNAESCISIYIVQVPYVYCLWHF